MNCMVEEVSSGDGIHQEIQLNLGSQKPGHAQQTRRDSLSMCPVIPNSFLMRMPEQIHWNIMRSICVFVLFKVAAESHSEPKCVFQSKGTTPLLNEDLGGCSSYQKDISHDKVFIGDQMHCLGVPD